MGGQRREMNAHGIPDNVEIDAIVSMNEARTKAYDVAPGDGRMCLPGFRLNAPRGFSYNFEQRNDGQIKSPVRFKVFPDSAADSGNRFLRMSEHLPEAGPVLMFRHIQRMLGTRSAQAPRALEIQE